MDQPRSTPCESHSLSGTSFRACPPASSAGVPSYAPGGARSRSPSPPIRVTPAHALIAADAARFTKGRCPWRSARDRPLRGFGSPRKGGCPPKMLQATSEPFALCLPGLADGQGCMTHATSNRTRKGHANDYRKSRPLQPDHKPHHRRT